MASLHQALVSAFLLFSLSLAAVGDVKKPIGPEHGSGRSALPLVFERNEGQMPSGIGFLGRTQHYTVAVEARDLRFFLPTAQGVSSVLLSFHGSHAAPASGVTESSFRTNYYVGTDPSRYRTGIKDYSRVGWKHVYPGIDVEFYASGDAIEHDFIVAPGADAGAIDVRIAGKGRASLNASGEVAIPSGEGELLLKRPVAYQVGDDGRHVEVASAFVLDAGEDATQRLRFRLGAYDHRRPLVIDPVIVYASFAAGTAGSTAVTIATDVSNNVYIAGTTASVAFASSPATQPVVNCGTAPCGNNLFVAQLPSGSNGSALGWITYIGAASSASTVNPSAMVASRTSVYVGGSTNDAALASGATSVAANPTTGYVGFISTLAASTGALSDTTLIYIDAVNPNNASVQALALDAAGDLFAGGELGATQTDAQAIAPTVNAFAVTPTVTTYSATANPQQPGNGFVMEFTAGTAFSQAANLASPAFFTYLQTNSQVNGLAVDAAGLVYAAGQTTGGFSLTEGAGPATNTTGLNDVFELTFTINPAAAPTVDALTWIDGAGNDTVAGLALDGTGQSYLFGNTTSTNLATTAGVVQTAPADAAANGFVALAGATGTASVPPVALTYLGGSGVTDTITGGGFANGAVYVTGRTDAPGTTGSGAVALGGVATTQASAVAPFNTQALAYGMDLTGGPARGYLASLPASLASLNYVADLGGTGGADSAVGVALDSAQNAYVAGNIGFGSSPYISSTAYQTSSPATVGTSAYVAEIAYAGTTAGLSLAVATGSPSIDPIGYASASQASSVTYTWTLNASSAAAPSNLVVQIPAQAALSYTSATITDSTNTGAAAIPCTIATAGVYCVIASVPQQTAGTNDTLSIAVGATVTSAAPTSGTISIAASVSGPASDYVTSTQTSQISQPSNLSVTLTASASSVYAASSANAANGTEVTYTFAVANAAGAGEAKQASLSFTGAFPTGFTVTGVSSSVAGTGASIGVCDTTNGATGCTSMDLPASTSLSYAITGYYDDATVFSGGSVASSASGGSFAPSASGFLNSTNPTLATNVTVTRSVTLSGTIATANASPNLSTTAVSSTVQYTYTVTNSGPSIAYGTNFATTYPAGLTVAAYVVDAASVSGGSGVSCTVAGAIANCTIAQIGPGASATIHATGSYPDLAPAADAVPAGASSHAWTQGASATAQAGVYTAGTSSSSFSVSQTVDRTATLVVAPTVANAAAGVNCGTALPTPCVYMYNPAQSTAANQFDTAVYTVRVTNQGPNTATAASLTVPLSIAPLNGSSTHPLTVASGTFTVNATIPTSGGWTAANTFSTASCTVSGSMPAQYVCTGGSGSPIDIPVGTNVVTLTAGGTFDAQTVPSTVLSVNTAAAAGSASTAATALGSTTSAALPPVSVVRSSHLVLRKTRNTTVAAAPATFADTVDPNLDEKKTATAFGVNDEIEYAVALGNGGVDDAPGVQFTETLPPYFAVSKMYLLAGTSATPDSGANAVPTATLAGAVTCYAGTTATGTALAPPFSSGGANQPITCVLAGGLTLVADNSTTGAPGTHGIEFVYQGKFQDNAPGADDIPAGQSKYTVASLAGDASATTALAVDSGPVADHLSLPVALYSIQRAAHLAVFGAPLIRQVSDTGLPSGVLSAEAEPSVGGGQPVFNCLRYKIFVQNAGPNIARAPVLSVNSPDAAHFIFNSSATGVTTTPGNDAALASSCAGRYGSSSSNSVAAAALSPVTEVANNSMVYDLDGYFDVNTLQFATDKAAVFGSLNCFGNCGSRIASVASLSDPGVSDSLTSGTALPPIPAVIVGNTPAGGNYLVSPFSATGTQPAQLSFTSVLAAGVTTESIAASGTVLPSGISPDPRDSRTVARPLYRAGSGVPNFYTMATTAVPAAGTNPTGVCLISGSSGPLSDGFAKPERALLWALVGLPAGSAVNPVPNVTLPYSGDITISVTPSGATSYVAPGGPSLPYSSYGSYPGAQSQPAQVCGRLNGFATTAAPLTLAVLEPVNFAPYISGALPGSSSAPILVGKGVSETSLSLAGVTAHDYNDSDPCYVTANGASSPTRGTCDDNPLLTTWVFLGSGSPMPILGPLTPSGVAATTSIEVSASIGDIYYQVADQLAVNANKATLGCDPGINSSGYAASSPNCPVTASFTGTPPQAVDFGSADVAQLTANLSGSGGAGLIVLPPAANPLSVITGVQSGYTAALATVTAGQTVGFLWKLSDVIPSAGGTYSLTCFMVDAATQNTAVAFPSGLSCQIPASVTYTSASLSSNPLDPAIYIVTTGTLNAKGAVPSVWRSLTGGIAFALLVPILLLRRRLAVTQRAGLLVALVLLGGAMVLSGCGSTFGTNTTAPVAADTYYFRVTATPSTGNGTYTTAPFAVKVAAGN